jgi:hypothetical protein
MTRQSMMTIGWCNPYGCFSSRFIMDARVKPGHDAEYAAGL